MAEIYAGTNTVYVPKFDEQAKLIVNYSRNQKDYAFNHLYTLSPVKNQIGKFMRIAPETQGRTSATYRAGRKWRDGNPRPIQLENNIKIEWLEFFCERNCIDAPLGNQAVDQAVFDLVAVQSGHLANQMMTDRADEFYTVLTTSGNYLSTNTDTATNAGGGKWDTATSANRYIQNSLMTMVAAIRKSTMNGVKTEDLYLVLGPNVAKQAAASGEVADYLAQNPDATRFIQGDLFKKQLDNYGLPPRLYGVNVVVDDLVKETAALGATNSKSFVSPDTSAFLISRPGAIDSNAGGSSFSFIHCFSYRDEEMMIEVTDDVFNKRKVLSVIDTRQFKVVGKESAYLLTAVVD